MTDPDINYATLSELSLDPQNPRLGRNNTGPDVKQTKILELMKDWSLEELAISFLESGFWPQEALIVVQEKLYGKTQLVVIEGNRRLAALKYLQGAIGGKETSARWVEIAKSKKAGKDLFERIPYIRVESREGEEVEAFLGFRHVTGIKEWNPAEKAQFIAKLIEKRGFTYIDVMRKIGSKTAAVRNHYIAFKLLIEMEDQEEIAIAEVEKKFSVLYLSLRTNGVQEYLGIDPKAEPASARVPVKKSKLPKLVNYARWMFGDGKVPPLFTDSRKVEQFGEMLENESVVAYLENTPKPNFESAYQLAGGGEKETIRLLDTAAGTLELALSKVHLHKKSKKISASVERFGKSSLQLLSIFPAIKKSLLQDEE